MMHDGYSFIFRNKDRVKVLYELINPVWWLIDDSKLFHLMSEKLDNENQNHTCNNRV